MNVTEQDPKAILERFGSELAKDADLAPVLAMIQPYQAMLAGDEAKFVEWLKRAAAALQRSIDGPIDG